MSFYGMHDGHVVTWLSICSDPTLDDHIACMLSLRLVWTGIDVGVRMVALVPFGLCCQSILARYNERRCRIKAETTSRPGVSDTTGSSRGVEGASRGLYLPSHAIHTGTRENTSSWCWLVLVRHVSHFYHIANVVC